MMATKHFPPNASMNYELLSLGHGSLFMFSFCPYVEEQERKGKEIMSSLSYQGAIYLYVCYLNCVYEKLLQKEIAQR